MQLIGLSVSFIISLTYICTQSRSENLELNHNNEFVSKLTIEFDSNNHLSQGVELLLENLRSEIQNDENLKAKFDGVEINGNFESINNVVNILENEFYTVDKTLQMYRYNKLLHNVKRLKSLSLLNHFSFQLKLSKDLRVALGKFHDLVNVEPKYFMDMFNEQGDDNGMNDKNVVSGGGAVDQKELDLVVQKDLNRNRTNMDPDKLINDDSLKLDQLFNEDINADDGNEHLNLKERWRVVSTLFKDPYKTNGWNSMLGVELFIAANGNLFVLGQFLWFEIVYKYYDDFFGNSGRKLFTWGNILHAKDNVRVEMVREICGIKKSGQGGNVSSLNGYELNEFIDIHCQALELVIEQINYMEVIYQNHISSNNITNDVTDASKGDGANFLEFFKFGKKNEAAPENSWYSIYPYRLYGTQYDDDVFNNPYVPTEPMGLQKIVNLKYNGVNNVNNDVVDSKFEQNGPLRYPPGEESIEFPEINPINTHIPSILKGEAAFKAKLMSYNDVKLLYTPKELVETFADDAQSFLTALYMYREDPIYGFYFNERISLGFEAIYNTYNGDSVQFYKPLKRNMMSCLKDLVDDKTSKVITGKLSLKINYKTIPHLFNLLDKNNDRYAYCRDYLGLAMFFVYKSVGYTNLEKSMLLVTPGGSSPMDALFTNKSYLLRDAVMLDKNWLTIVLMLRVVTLRNGIKGYNDMKNKNLESIVTAQQFWSKEKIGAAIVERWKMYQSTYSSILLERSLSNNTLEKLISSIKFILHYNTFITLDRFSKKVDNLSLIEAMNKFIGAWTKYGYTKSREEILAFKNVESNTDTEGKLFNWMDKDYINLGDWNEQLYGLILWYLQRFLQQPYIKHLIEMNEKAPGLYKLPNYIQLAIDSLNNLKLAEDKLIMMTSIADGENMNLWYPVLIDHKSIMQVLEEVFFVGEVMKEVFNEGILRKSFTRLCTHLQYFTYSHYFHTPGVSFEESLVFVPPHYSNYSHEARKCELQKSMAFTEFASVWNLLYHIGMPLVANKDHLFYMERKLTVDMWKRSLLDPKSIQNLSRVAPSNDIRMEKLKKQFYKSRSIMNNTLKSGSTVWGANITSLIGHLYYYIGVKKLGNNMIVFSPYLSYIVNHWNKKGTDKLSKKFEKQNEYETPKDYTDSIDNSQLGFLEMFNNNDITNNMENNELKNKTVSMIEFPMFNKSKKSEKSTGLTKSVGKRGFFSKFKLAKMFSKPSKVIKIFLLVVIPSIFIAKFLSPLNFIFILVSTFGLGYFLKRTRVLPMLNFGTRRMLG